MFDASPFFTVTVAPRATVSDDGMYM